MTDADPNTQGYAVALQVATNVESPQVRSLHPALHSHEVSGANLAYPLHKCSFLMDRCSVGEAQDLWVLKPHCFPYCSRSSNRHLCKLDRKGRPGDRGSWTAHVGSPSYP